MAALILTGSMARDEATIVAREGTCVVLGDAEFVAIFERHTCLPPDAAVKELCSAISTALTSGGIRTAISISAGHPDYLRKLGPEIFACELRECGRTVWGDPGILQLIPTFSPLEISREDAWRLLCNRMLELIEVAPGALISNERFSSEHSYRVLKLWLDMATSFLVFRGQWAPSYQKRQKVLTRVSEQVGQGDAPFDLAVFAETIESCTQFKLHGSCPEISWDEWVRTVDWARCLWRWETARLAEIAEYNFESDDVLMSAYIRTEPLRRRARGWLYVLRSCGWLRSWRYWARWTRMAPVASPRCWTYAAATHLFFKLPELMKADSDFCTDRELPLPYLDRRRLSWSATAAQVTLNYHAFVEKTRA